jgi:hypothetical protein
MQVAEVSEGELFRVETIDWTGGQIADNDCADDIKHVDLTQVRALVRSCQGFGGAGSRQRQSRSEVRPKFGTRGGKNTPQQQAPEGGWEAWPAAHDGAAPWRQLAQLDSSDPALMGGTQSAPPWNINS